MHYREVKFTTTILPTLSKIKFNIIWSLSPLSELVQESSRNPLPDYLHTAATNLQFVRELAMEVTRESLIEEIKRVVQKIGRDYLSSAEVRFSE